MNCFVLRVDGVLCGPRRGLLSLLGLVDGAPEEGKDTARRRGLRRHRRALVCACVRRAALGCFINPKQLARHFVQTKVARKC